MFLRTLFNWLVPPFRAIETTLLNALSERLSADARLLLARQVEQVNLVQRHADDKEVNLYRIKFGRPSLDEATSFPVKGEETKLASASFEARGVPDVFRADFWLVRGHLFSITFNKSPKRIRAADIRIRDVQTFIDPMQPPEALGTRPISQHNLTGWLRDWATRWQLSNLREPVAAERRAGYIRQLGAVLPADYLELVAQTEGLEVDGCVIYGLSEIRHIVMPDGGYQILAERREKGMLAVREEEGVNPEIYFLSYEDDRPLRLGTSFRLAIERSLSTL